MHMNEVRKKRSYHPRTTVAHHSLLINHAFGGGLDDYDHIFDVVSRMGYKFPIEAHFASHLWYYFHKSLISDFISLRIMWKMRRSIIYGRRCQISSLLSSDKARIRLIGVSISWEIIDQIRSLWKMRRTAVVVSSLLAVQLENSISRGPLPTGEHFRPWDQSKSCFSEDGKSLDAEGE